MICPRCKGFLVLEWDVENRAQYHRCLMCGSRPHQVAYRVDGQPIGAPLLCIDCGVRPRMTIVKRHSKGEDELSRCEACRAIYNRKRANWKRQQYTRGPYKTYTKHKEG